VRGSLARADLRVNGRQGDTLALTVSGEATLERLAVTEGSRSLVSAARVAVGGLEYTWPTTVRVADLTLTGPSVIIERDAAGAINLTSLVPPTTTALATDDAAPSSTSGCGLPTSPPCSRGCRSAGSCAAPSMPASPPSSTCSRSRWPSAVPWAPAIWRSPSPPDRC
jgi:hypothetical protein